MQKKILKRDGTEQLFESFKIEDAIKKAFKSVNVQYDVSVFFNVLFEIKQKRLVAVEDIQDIIEKEFYKARYFEVMKSFMLYRHLHKIQREQILQLDSDTTYINSTQTIDEYINGSDWRIKANSNTGYSHAGLINNSAGKIIANYWLDKIYSKKEGYIYLYSLNTNDPYYLKTKELSKKLNKESNMKIELLQGSLPVTENPGLDSTDPRFDEIATLVQGGQYAEAAKLSETILAEGIYDIRLMCYFLYGYWLELDLLSLLEVMNCLNHIILENWQAVGPVKKREKFFQTSFNWLFRQVLKKIQYEEKKKTALWQ